MPKTSVAVLLSFLFIVQTPAHAETQGVLTKADLENFAALVLRDFKTPSSDTKNIILDRRLRIDDPPAEGIWFYGQLNTGPEGKLYRQRLHQITLSQDGAAIIQKSYGLNEPGKYADAWNNPELLTGLTNKDFKSYFEKGCEQRWTKQADGSWYGHVDPKTCTVFSKRRNKHIRIESEGKLSAAAYQTNERGFEMDGSFLWGTQPGEFITLHPLKKYHSDLPGIYSNEEQVYFDRDAGKKPASWLSLQIAEKNGELWLKEIDAFGKGVSEGKPLSFDHEGKRAILRVDGCSRFFDKSDDGWNYSKRQNRMACDQRYQITKISSEGLLLRFADGTESRLKRARPVQCWAAIPKRQKKEDGSTDWFFARQLDMHDQGGRVSLGGGDTGAEEVILRMRAVHWPPPSRNRPSMVLYIHKPDDPDRAVSYSWADIDATRVGINLRWMQASCTISGAERSSEVTSTSFSR